MHLPMYLVSRSANTGTSAHGLYGATNTEVRDHFYWYQNQSPWITSDNSYFYAHVYRSDGSDLGFRVPFKYMGSDDQLYNTWSGILVHDELYPQGSNRNNTLRGSYEPMD